MAGIPDDEDDLDLYDGCDDDFDCYHENYDADILTGEAWCSRCQHKWIMTSEEITREIEFQAEYMRCIEEEESATAIRSTPQETKP
ncbi:hypothetical protein DTW90_36155 [Neorhizobium sp. P12A]|uniref:hypothetical protein n=1 Tax=Neorhizobium sp. P12A TaxID=2268027 RepID=UPI0011ED715E|nr:hypothetical protein [Neorhizobium sp. P12A]KAA0684575.1 hypothetical protein DTW90_36155 [Neorhizobium sp. P12A]